MKYKTLMRTVISLALCLVVCAGLFCMPAFAAGNTLVIIGSKVDKTEAAEPANSVVVSGGSSVGASSSGSGIASDGPAATQVIVGGKVKTAAGKSRAAPLWSSRTALLLQSASSRRHRTILQQRRQQRFPLQHLRNPPALQLNCLPRSTQSALRTASAP